MTEKEKRIQECMDLLEGSYTRESVVFQTVEKGLKKMSLEEIGGVYSMLLTRVKVKKI
jgi:hypothetical protein